MCYPRPSWRFGLPGVRPLHPLGHNPLYYGWFNGVGVTNVGNDNILCRVDYICDNSVERFDVGRKSVFTFVADVKNTGYAKFRATGPGYVTVMIGDGRMMQGFLLELVPIDEE